MTVLGPIEPDALGTTLIHEHILFDRSVHHRQRFGPGKAEPLPDEPLRIEHLHVPRHNVARLFESYPSHTTLAALGCTLALDTFGKQSYYPTRGRQYPS